MADWSVVCKADAGIVRSRPRCGVLLFMGHLEGEGHMADIGGIALPVWAPDFRGGEDE